MAFVNLLVLLYIAIANGPIYSMEFGLGSFAKNAAVPVFIFYGLSIIAKNHVRKPHLYHIVFFLFVLWNAASLLWTAEPATTWFQVQRYLPMVLMAYMIWDVLRTPRQFNQAINAYVLGAAVICIQIFYSYLRGDATWNTRFSSSDFNPNDLAVVVSTAVPVAWYLACSTTATSKLLRLAYAMYPLVANIAIILSGSRGGAIGVFIADISVLLMIYNIPKRWRIATVTSLVAPMAITTTINFEKSIKRLMTLFTITQESGYISRIDLWRQALITFSEHPFLGVGSGTYIVAIRDASVRDRNLVHNTFLSVLAETGLIGITLYGIILYLAVKMLMRQQSLLRMAFLSALVVFCLVTSTVSFEMRIQTWLFFSLLILSANCLQTQETPAAVKSVGDARPLKLETP